MRAATRALVVRRGALGDTILMLPALRMILACGRWQQLEFAGNLDHAAVLLEYGIVDRVRSTEDLRLWEGPAALAQLAADYDRTFVEGHDFDSKIQESCRRPAAEEFLHRIAASIGLPAAGSPIPQLVTERAAPTTPPLMVVAPGAGSPAKRAPLARFAAAISAAHARDHRVALVLGEVEELVAEALIAGLPPTEEIWRGLPITELARRLERASGFVGNDSGVTHLAAALLVPTTALFVTTDPAVWAPTGDHVRVEQLA